MTIPRQAEKANLSQTEKANASVKRLLVNRQRRLSAGFDGDRFQFLSSVAVPLHHEDRRIVKNPIQRAQ